MHSSAGAARAHRADADEAAAEDGGAGLTVGRDPCDKRLQLRLVDDCLPEAVLRVENDVGLVVVPVQPRPGHLLVAAPGDADRPSGRIPRDVDVVAAPGA